MKQELFRNYVTDEQPFKITKTHFSVGESATGYTLQKSVDCFDSNGKTVAGTNATWADYARNGSTVTIAANNQLEVDGCGPNCWWRLKNNTGKVYYE